MKIAYLFSGQGAQYPGMGKSLYEENAQARAVFDQLESALPGTLALCFEGDRQTLSQTIHTQRCMYAVDLACAMAVHGMGLPAQGAAGFSVGEFPAAAYAGLFSPQRGMELICLRARIMEACADKTPGGMAAVLKLSARAVEELIKDIPNVWAVNYNSAEQTVISGMLEGLEAARARILENKGRFMPLQVSGPFHTAFMEPASKALWQELLYDELPAPRIPLYSNITAGAYAPDTARGLLSGQASQPVRFLDTLMHMAEGGFDTFIEVGPGKVLSGLVRRALPQAAVYNVGEAADLQNLPALK